MHARYRYPTQQARGPVMDTNSAAVQWWYGENEGMEVVFVSTPSVEPNVKRRWLQRTYPHPANVYVCISNKFYSLEDKLRTNRSEAFT
jgi:hypothetical protein